MPIVDEAMPAEPEGEVLADAPVIPDRGSYGLPDLEHGPHFGEVIKDLLSARFRSLVEEKFDIDLSNQPALHRHDGQHRGNYNEGYAHPDSKHKIITVLLGFTASGRMRRASCACCAATIATTSPSNTRPNSAGC